MFFGLFFTFSFFFFFEVLVFTHLMCACTCCRDPKQIFVSLPISLARGLKKYILSCFFCFFSLTSFKVETGEDTQLPTRVSFLTRSLFVVCSNVFLLFYSGVGLESMNVLREKETGHFKNKTKKGNGERVWTETFTGSLHRFHLLKYVPTDWTEPVFSSIYKKKKSLSKHGGRSFFFMALLNRFNLFWQWETRRGVSWRIFMRTWFFFLAGVECVWTTFMKKKKNVCCVSTKQAWRHQPIFKEILILLVNCNFRHRIRTLKLLLPSVWSGISIWKPDNIRANQEKLIQAVERRLQTHRKACFGKKKKKKKILP